MKCNQCAKPTERNEKAAVIVAEGEGTAEYGFCSVACMVIFVRRRWIEAA